MEIIVSILGWMGVAFCTLGFLLLNTKTLNFDSWIYQTINIVGGFGLVVSALYFHDLPNITSNSIWMIIALYGLLRPYLTKRDEKKEVVKPN
ncbi:CBU_0592 family membrane protein [Sphingobacterium hungaricum]|uniref:CBU-0592-like domain-containing protein n=1 Tax=Sphingobacterium hungaricum TaxID=2082723 RepID=A0A928UTV5_9SPHI|nr:hypothetical protein [Sphingobacterium hungaricum]MBE8712642.1 hypothetical protein [Sphingobacterium hungaricum]